MNANRQFTDYAAIAAELTRTALHQAASVTALGSPHPSLALALPAVKKLIGESISCDALQPCIEALQTQATRYDDAIGFTRPVYHPLIVRLCALAGATISEAALQPMHEHAQDFDLELWRCAALHACGQDVTQRLNRALASSGDDGALHPRETDEQLDAWTFCELAAMHALHAIGDPQHTPKLAAAIDHHTRLTQPDYTTYQPWAVAAFACAGPGGAMFADQQLHDATTNLHLDPRSSSAIALILADAVHTLEHR